MVEIVAKRFYPVESSYIRDRVTGKLYDLWNNDDVVELRMLKESTDKCEDC
jgi:hypothetical protein